MAKLSHSKTAGSKQTNSPFQPFTGLEADGVVNEMTILGNGFFVVRDPMTGQSYATQMGHFGLDWEGHLITETGARLQGRTHGAHSSMGDIQINTTGLSSTGLGEAAMLCYSIDERGKIIVYLNDGTSFLRGQIMLQNFRDPEALVSEGGQLYSNLTAAGPLAALAAPCTNGLGEIHWGVLELAFAGSHVWAN